MNELKNIKLEINDKIGVLTLNRPEALNALNRETLSEIKEIAQKISKMNFDEIRVLILTGSGAKAFVAGADIKEISELSSEAAQIFSRLGQEAFSALENLQIPVIAAVNGFALGGGLELAMACDFIYASENAKFGLPEVTLGLIPGFGGTVRLARYVGPQKAKELIYTGNMLSANEAREIGLVNKVLSNEDLMVEVLKMAKTISLRGPVAVSVAKKMVHQGWDLAIEAAQLEESQKFGALFNSQDMREGTAAFIEKRKAQFLGK